MYAERKGDIEVIWRGRLAELAVPDFITRVNFALELISWKERSGRTQLPPSQPDADSLSGEVAPFYT